MAAQREPRRTARQGWEPGTHFGELDADIDELHTLRERDAAKALEALALISAKHEADIARLEKKLDRLITTVWAATLSGMAAAATLAGNIALRFLEV